MTDANPTLLEQLAGVSSSVATVLIGDQSFYIRVLSGTERDEWEEIVANVTSSEKRCGRSKTYADLLVRALSTAQGKRAFKDDARDALAESVDHKTLKRLFEAAVKYNLIGEEGVDDAKKGSAAGPTSDSGTPLPAPSE
jgi:hypothetical protein